MLLIERITSASVLPLGKTLFATKQELWRSFYTLRKRGHDRKIKKSDMYVQPRRGPYGPRCPVRVYPPSMD
jgi:hypothetical protein